MYECVYIYLCIFNMDNLIYFTVLVYKAVLYKYITSCFNFHTKGFYIDLRYFRFLPYNKNYKIY